MPKWSTGRAGDARVVARGPDEGLGAAVDQERQRADQRDRPARRAERLLPRPHERAEAQPHALRAQDREEAQGEDGPGVVAAPRHGLAMLAAAVPVNLSPPTKNEAGAPSRNAPAPWPRASCPRRGALPVSTPCIGAAQRPVDGTKVA